MRLVVERTQHLEAPPRRRLRYKGQLAETARYSFALPLWRGADFFRADTTLYNYVSARARQWLIDRYPSWLAFKLFQTK